MAAGLLALVGWLALALQLALIVGATVRTGGSALAAVVTYLSFFTILTNGIVAVVMTRIALGRPVGAAPLGAALVYILIVGLVYSALLRATWAPEGWQKLVDHALHDAMPLLTAAFWLAFAPKGRLRWRHAVVWLAFPLAFCFYSLVRGAFVGWYPYPFLDAAQLGHGAVLVNAAVLSACFLALGLALVALDRALGRAAGRGGSS